MTPETAACPPRQRRNRSKELFLKSVSSTSAQLHPPTPNGHPTQNGITPLHPQMLLHVTYIFLFLNNPEL